MSQDIIKQFTAWLQDDDSIAMGLTHANEERELVDHIAKEEDYWLQKIQAATDSSSITAIGQAFHDRHVGALDLLKHNLNPNDPRIEFFYRVKARLDEALNDYWGSQN